MMIKRRTIRVLVADDHPAVRDGIRAYLAEQEGIEVIDMSRNGDEAMEKAGNLRPDILILDVTMPGANGFTVARELRKTMPEIKIIALSVHETKESVLGMVRLGVKGYITKTAAPSELVKAIRAVSNGGTSFSPSVAHVLLDDYIKNAGTIGEESRLSSREKEILGQVAQGYTSRGIAQRFHISQRTVETHRLHIRKKLGQERSDDLAGNNGVKKSCRAIA